MTTVGASILWGAGSWTPSAALRATLDQEEGKYLRWMTGLRKRPEEQWLPFYRRRHRATLEFHRDGRPNLWRTAVQRVHGWYGHLRRHADSPAAKVATWRSLLWWRTVQFARPSHDRTLRHPRRGWRRGAEECFESCFGDIFPELAADRQRWSEARSVFLRWCCTRFGGSPPARPPGPKRPRRASEPPLAAPRLQSVGHT